MFRGRWKMVSFSKLRRLVAQRTKILDRGDFYLIRFPRNMSNSGNGFVREITREMSYSEKPVVMDFRRVRDFDSSGAAALFLLFQEYPDRKFYAFGVPYGIKQEIDLYKLDFLWQVRVNLYKTLDEIAQRLG